MAKTKAELRIDFLLVEHACLQEKIRHTSADLYRTETIIPLAIGVTYAWLFGRATGAAPIPLWIWWSPVAVSIFGGLRQYLRYKSLWASHKYVRFIEHEFYGPTPDQDDGHAHGWEGHWLRGYRFHTIWKWKRSSHALMRIAFWLFLVAGTAFLANQQTRLIPSLA